MENQCIETEKGFLASPILEPRLTLSMDVESTISYRFFFFAVVRTKHTKHIGDRVPVEDNGRTGE